MKYKNKSLLFLFFLVLLVGCGKTPEEKIQTTLEKVRNEEQGYEEQQQSIAKLEKEERELFEEIIEKNSAELDDIEEIAKKAIKNIDERSKKIGLEKDSIEQSKEEFKKVNKQTKKLEDQDLEKQAKDLMKQMDKRYEVYNELYKIYENMLEKEKEFYQEIKKEEVEKEELEEILIKLNKTYESVIEKNTEFNNITEKYNETKKTFYDKADI